MNENQAIMYPEIKGLSEAPRWVSGKLDYTKANEFKSQTSEQQRQAISPVFPDQQRSPLLYILAGVAGVLSVVVLVYARASRKRG